VASIVLDSIKKPDTNSAGFTYSDLHLDLEFNYTRNNELKKIKEIKDSINDYDYGCIKNSIFNLFTTIPGQKVLNPYFGLNLMQYIFEPVSKTNAIAISNAITKGIKLYEPRVDLKNLEIIVDAEKQEYEINMIISVVYIPNSSFKLVGTLSNSGFYFNN